MAADQQDFAAKYGPWAIVAGASDGTGSEFAEQLAARGVNVVLVARRQALLDDIAERLPTQSRVVVLDLSTPDAGQRLAEATADLDIGLLVYNAGADQHSTAFLSQPIDDLRSLVRRNCLTVLDACYDVGTRLIARGRGGVILVTSGAAWCGGANIAAYGGTKAFDLVLAEALWAEWKPQGVDVLALVMGATDTPSLQRLLAETGGSFGELARPADVVRDALNNVHDGPTWICGMPEPQGGSPFGALSRRQAVELMSQGSAAVHGD
jgi:short-subunit dehydrogenase